MTPITLINEALHLFTEPTEANMARVQVLLIEARGKMREEAEANRRIKAGRNRLHDALHALLRSGATDGKHPAWHEAFEVADECDPERDNESPPEAP